MSAYHIDSISLQSQAQRKRGELVASTFAWVSAAFTGIWAAVFGALNRWFERRAIAVAVENLSPRVLEDIGMTREELLAKALNDADNGRLADASTPSRAVPVAANEDAPAVRQAA